MTATESEDMADAKAAMLADQEAEMAWIRLAAQEGI